MIFRLALLATHFHLMMITHVKRSTILFGTTLGTNQTWNYLDIERRRFES